MHIDIDDIDDIDDSIPHPSETLFNSFNKCCWCYRPPSKNPPADSLCSPINVFGSIGCLVESNSTWKRSVCFTQHCMGHLLWIKGGFLLLVVLPSLWGKSPFCAGIPSGTCSQASCAKFHTLEIGAVGHDLSGWAGHHYRLFLPSSTQTWQWEIHDDFQLPCLMTGG